MIPPPRKGKEEEEEKGKGKEEDEWHDVQKTKKQEVTFFRMGSVQNFFVLRPLHRGKTKKKKKKRKGKERRELVA